jgi:hypothetical protein
VKPAWIIPGLYGVARFGSGGVTVVTPGIVWVGDQGGRPVVKTSVITRPGLFV